MNITQQHSCQSPKCLELPRCDLKWLFVPCSRAEPAAACAKLARDRLILRRLIIPDNASGSIQSKAYKEEDLRILTRAHVITGSFGSGKTTAIRRQMALKPEDELWVVILNEFTDAGIDALSVAQSARGSYDVRLVAGGCLCCVGELEFGKQLRDILRNFKPARLLIEPSGAGHAADIVDTLALYESQQALELHSVICLVDPQDAAQILARAAAQRMVADSIGRRVAPVETGSCRRGGTWSL